MRKGGCWIFLSHSSKDIQKVRQIRNEFEKMGHNPLAFHLLCLNDKTKRGKTELDNLIKREIDAREWFVFCDSPNAQQSQYVADEQNYVKSRGKQMIWTIDLQQDMDKILADVRKICTHIEVFLSYSHADQQLADRLLHILEMRDYAVWSDKDLSPCDNWVTQTTDAISNCSKSGVFLVLLTEKSVGSNYLLKEIHYAAANDATILPIVIENARLTPVMELLLENYNAIHLPSNFTTQDCESLISIIDETIKSSTF